MRRRYREKVERLKIGPADRFVLREFLDQVDAQVSPALFLDGQVVVIAISPEKTADSSGAGPGLIGADLISTEE